MAKLARLQQREDDSIFGHSTDYILEDKDQCEHFLVGDCLIIVVASKI